MAEPKLLIVEDDPGLSSQYRWAFPGYALLFAPARKSAVALLARERPAVMIMDLGLPPDPDGVSEGFATLSQTLQLAPDTKVIVVTSHGDRSHALRAIAAGAYDFCEKPIEIDLLRGIVVRAQRLAGLEEENRRLAEAPLTTPIRRIITASEPMLKICRSIERLATTNVTVLLAGESGTGKEALATALHELGPRSKSPFVAINCGAIPENLLESELFGHERGAFTGAVARNIGKIEQAQKGTLFLDEIGDLPLQLQVKLLRFLQEQVIERIGGRVTIPVDVRVVSATNQGLDQLVAEGRFRADLFYRLNPVTVRIPPLRERTGDAMLLARWFLTRFNREFARNLRGFGDTAAAAIEGHGWPGNVRELENRMKRAVVMAEGRLIEPHDLELTAGAEQAQPLDLRGARRRAEHEMLTQALARGTGTLSAAARLLGVSRPTLYGLLETHGLTRQVAEAGYDIHDDEEAASPQLTPTDLG
jgi:two-component system, NtrC family, response regulator